jgi:hypothetical protein
MFFVFTIEVSTNIELLASMKKECHTFHEEKELGIIWSPQQDKRKYRRKLTCSTFFFYTHTEHMFVYNRREGVMIWQYGIEGKLNGGQRHLCR